MQDEGCSASMTHNMTLRSLSALVLLSTGPAFAQDAEDAVGGVGRLACSEVSGPGNAAYLGQVADWALGYMAGRIDAGQTPSDDATLSPSDSIDVITGIASRCNATPSAPVIDAVSAIGSATARRA